LSSLKFITKSALTHKMMHIVIKLENLKGLRGAELMNESIPRDTTLVFALMLHPC
jgi:hypothetical protein